MVTRYVRNPLSSTSIGDAAGRIRFGGGINTLASPTDINDDECCDGYNFDLQYGDRAFNVRKGIQKVFQAPNDQAIVGYASLRELDGTVTLLLQAGDTVYNWDGTDTTNATNVGVVDASARLRGPETANWLYAGGSSTGLALITDLALVETVKYWDGTTFDEVNFTKNNGANAYGSFKAKYCTIYNEHAIYANVVDSTGNPWPQLLVSSRLDAYDDLSTDDRPSSAIGDADPWFLPSSDLKPIGALVNAFGQLVIATVNGQFSILTGTEPSTIVLEQLFTGLTLSDYEAVTATGNDLVFASQGVVMSLKGVQNYGDVEGTELSLWISPTIRPYPNWRIVYNRRFHKIYCFPTTYNNCYVCNTSFIDSGMSPWMQWRTYAEHDLQPQVVFVAKRPGTNLEETFLSDSSGGLYIMEGSLPYDNLADGTNAAIPVKRRSKTLVGDADQTGYNFDLYVEYQPTEAQTIDVSLITSGAFPLVSAQSLTLKARSGVSYWGDNVNTFFGGFYFGAPASPTYIRQRIGARGQSDMLQIELAGSVSTTTKINAIGLRNETTD